MKHILEPGVTFLQALKVPEMPGTVSYMEKTQKDALTLGFASRLNEVCDEMGVPGKYQGRQLALGRQFGVTQKAARKWLEGEGLPTLTMAITIAKWAGVNVQWLLTGEGPKNVAPVPEPAMPAVPDEMRAELADFMRFKAERMLAGEGLARYLRWLDKVIPPKQG